VKLRASFLEGERRTLLAGGLLAELRAGGEGLPAGVVISAAADQGSPVSQPGHDEAVKSGKEAEKMPR
ncbi:MAG: hypothetical protein ACRDF0_03605, partial [Candidatus Limnocylindria bacterium]